MENLGYYNGTTGTLDEIQVPMLDRVCFYGDGVYDATMAANHVIFALEEHIDRFYRSAAELEIEIPMEKGAFATLLQSLVKRVDHPNQFVYWQVTRGTAPRAHAFPKAGKANLWVMLVPEDLPDLNQRVDLVTTPDTRFYHCNIKTLNLIPNVMAAEKAARAGCEETIFHRDGRVTECAHSNVHILKDGVFITAPADNLILPGIARAHLLRMCERLGIPTEERAYTLDELMAADEVMISSSSNFCHPAKTVDGVPVGGRATPLVQSLVDALCAEFDEATRPDQATIL